MIQHTTYWETDGCGCLQGELAVKNADLAVAARSAEKMLHEISESTAAAEKEKSKVAVIVDDVSKTAAVRLSPTSHFSPY